jgi:hypothetical protein
LGFPPDYSCFLALLWRRALLVRAPQKCALQTTLPLWPLLALSKLTLAAWLGQVRGPKNMP